MDHQRRFVPDHSISLGAGGTSGGPASSRRHACQVIHFVRSNGQRYRVTARVVEFKEIFMYIGGGLLVLILIIVVVVLLMRRA